MTERPQTTPNRVEITEEQRRQILRELNRPRSRLRMFVDWAKSLVVAIVLFLLIRTFLVEAFKIPTGSMERTLLVGDFLLVNKAVYGAEIPFTSAHLPPIARPQRGDIIVFEWPKDPSKNFVKRLIGLRATRARCARGSYGSTDVLSMRSTWITPRPAKILRVRTSSGSEITS